MILIFWALSTMTADSTFDAEIASSTCEVFTTSYLFPAPEI